MCNIVYLPDESEIWYVGELERAFGKPVEGVLDTDKQPLGYLPSVPCRPRRARETFL